MSGPFEYGGWLSIAEVLSVWCQVEKCGKVLVNGSGRDVILSQAAGVGLSRCQLGGVVSCEDSNPGDTTIVFCHGRITHTQFTKRTKNDITN